MSEDIDYKQADIRTPGCPEIRYVDQDDLKFRDAPAFSSQMLGLNAMHHHTYIYLCKGVCWGYMQKGTTAKRLKRWILIPWRLSDLCTGSWTCILWKSSTHLYVWIISPAHKSEEGTIDATFPLMETQGGTNNNTGNLLLEICQCFSKFCFIVLH